MTYQHLKILLRTFVDSEVKERAEPYRKMVAAFLRELADDIDPQETKTDAPSEAD